MFAEGHDQRAPGPHEHGAASGGCRLKQRACDKTIMYVQTMSLTKLSYEDMTCHIKQNHNIDIIKH